MQATDEDIDNDDKAIVRSVRFNPQQWDAVTKHTEKYGIKHGTFLRNAALKMAGYATEVDGMRNTAAALARAVEGDASPAENAPPDPPAAPPKPRARRKAGKKSRRR